MTEHSPNFDRPFRNWNHLTRRDRRLLHERRDHRREAIARLKFAVGIEKLSAPFPVVAENFVELRARTQKHDALVEHARRAETFRVPRRHFAEHAAAMLSAE